LLSALMIHVGIAAGYFIEPDSVNFAHVTVASGDSGILAAAALILSIMFTLNLILFVFNLLPVPPLDGSGALPLVMKEEHALSYMNFTNHSGFAFFGLFIAWNLFDKLFDPIHLMAINMLYPGAGYH
jgi:Zn-dependent protease